MKNVVVLIERDEVLKRVARAVAYIGAKAVSEGDVYDAVRVVKEDDEELGVLFDESLDGLFTQLSPYLVDHLPSEDVLLRVPLNFDMAQGDVLRQLMNDYCVNMVVSEWFALCGLADRAKEYDDKATSQIGLIKETLNKRVRPLQPLYDEEHEIIPRRKHVEQ